MMRAGMPTWMRPMSDSSTCATTIRMSDMA